MGIDYILNWLVVKAPLFTAGAAVTGAVVAILGYRKWFQESVGKRKIELAEDVLADFYKAKEVIAWARFPGGYGSEGGTRQAAEEENPQEKLMKDSYYRTIERLHGEIDLFNGLQSKKYRAMAYFGEEAGQPFQDLKGIHGRVMTAAGMLVRTFRSDREQHRSWEKWEAIIGWGVEPEADDGIANEIDGLIERVESIYGQWLMRKIPKSTKSDRIT